MATVRDPAHDLQQVRAVRLAVSGRTRCPPYMHVVFGALLGGLVAAEAAPDGATLAIEGAIAMAGVVIFLVQRRRLGLFVNGYRRGRTRSVALALVAIYLCLFSMAAYLKEAERLHWPALALGLVMTGLGAWGSLAWRRRYEAELSGERAA